MTTAHGGHVNGLCFTHDGLHLVSFGTDDRLRLWDAITGKNTLVSNDTLCNTPHKTDSAIVRRPSSQIDLVRCQVRIRTWSLCLILIPLFPYR